MAELQGRERKTFWDRIHGILWITRFRLWNDRRLAGGSDVGDFLSDVSAMGAREEVAQSSSFMPSLPSHSQGRFNGSPEATPALPRQLTTDAQHHLSHSRNLLFDVTNRLLAAIMK